MADAYGGIVVSHNTEFDADMDALCESLNAFWGWDNEGGNFVVSGCSRDHRIWFNSVHSQYPSLLPERETHIVLKCEETGERTKVHVDEATDEQWDKAWSYEVAEIPLKEIAQALSPHIERGELTLACSSNEKNRAVNFQMMKIRANGSASRLLNVVDWMGRCETISEVEDAVAA